MGSFSSAFQPRKLLAVALGSSPAATVSSARVAAVHWQQERGQDKWQAATSKGEDRSKHHICTSQKASSRQGLSLEACTKDSLLQ